ncbi:MAG: PAS domain-containing sensor histidine kinase [Patescibacteria group bacterium]
MKKARLKHFILSLFIFGLLFILIQISRSIVQDIFANPSKYFDPNLSITEISYLVFYNSAILISVLLSYTIYLLFGANIRAEASATIKTRALSEAVQQLTDIYESAPVPYLVLDSKANILIPNKAALRFFGVIKEEILGKNLFYYQPKEDGERVEKFISYYNSNLPINREEARMITKNGKIKSVLLFVFHLTDRLHKGHAGLAVIFDITEEQDLAKAKSEFLSLASHQLKTPAATIKWYSDVLLSSDLGELNQKQRGYAQKIYEVNENMIDLVDTLLNVSRTEIGSLPVDIKSTNVPEIIENVLGELSGQILVKQLKISKLYDKEMENLKSDPKLLRIVIQNLLSNAIKYTPARGSVSIKLEESWSNKSITISDTGIGIPPSEQGGIFSKLFRASNTKDLVDVSGTGLGLYLVKSIMETLKGSIDFKSEQNKGSVFTIKFN